MADGFREPTTEEEAREIERFLKEGAETSIEVIERFETRAGATAVLDEPARLEFDVTLDQLLRAVEETDERRVTIALDIAEIQGAGAFVAQVFLNNPDARAETPVEDPSFIGSLSVFPHDEGHIGPDEAGDGQALRYELDLTSRLQELADLGEGLVATVVLVPVPDAAAESAGLSVTGATITVLDSIVRIAT